MWGSCRNVAEESGCGSRSSDKQLLILQMVEVPSNTGSEKSWLPDTKHDSTMTLKRPKIIYKAIQCNILKGFNLNLDFSAITSNQKELWTHLFYHPEGTGTKRPGAWMIIHTNKIIFWRQLLRRLSGKSNCRCVIGEYVLLIRTELDPELVGFFFFFVW
jgi:hypothetical protein